MMMLIYSSPQIYKMLMPILNELFTEPQVHFA
jgi:hypothetical protein